MILQKIKKFLDNWLFMTHLYVQHLDLFFYLKSNLVHQIPIQSSDILYDEKSKFLMCGNSKVINIHILNMKKRRRRYLME